MIPSASVVATLRREAAGRPQATGPIAILADPVFEQSDPRVTLQTASRSTSRPKPHAARPATTIAGADGATPAPGTRHASPVPDITLGAPPTRLPFSREEANAIATLAQAQPGEVLKAIGFQASRTTALDGTLARFRIVHFATHGVVDVRRPSLTGLVLSLVDERGIARDGYLRLHDIYNLRLNADLVVLSACDTALGESIRGEGLVGLVRAFMYSGTPRVVASLWEVNDVATAQLMKAFYRELLRQRLPPAAALRAAQREIARDARWSAPYYWAGFVLQGDWK